MEEDDVSERLRVRKRIIEIYSKERSDFETLRDYDDYLEHREEIIFALQRGERLDEVEKEIAQYTSENQESIALYKRRRLEEKNAAVQSSLDKMTGLVSSKSESGGIKGLQPQPITSGHKLTQDGSIEFKRRHKNSTEWHIAAKAGGWRRSDYYEFVRHQVLTNLCTKQ